VSVPRNGARQQHARRDPWPAASVTASVGVDSVSASGNDKVSVARGGERVTPTGTKGSRNSSPRQGPKPARIRLLNLEGDVLADACSGKAPSSESNLSSRSEIARVSAGSCTTTGSETPGLGVTAASNPWVQPEKKVFTSTVPVARVADW
jgi:hypothetical protein